MMKILGLHFGSHDTSAALVIDGKLVAMIEEERFNHHKHTAEFPHNAIRFCLQAAEVGLAQIDRVAYASDVNLTNHYKQIFIEANYEGAMCPDLSTQEQVETELCAELGANLQFHYVDHHFAHATSSFLLSPFRESAIFTVDGMGNWVTTSFSKGKGEKIDTLERVPHPHSLGLYYGAITQYLGFSAACDEGKTMGLAPYGKPVYADLLRHVCAVREGQVLLDLDYFTFHQFALTEERPWFSSNLIELLGEARLPDGKLEQHHANVAASAQLILEECCFSLLNHLHRLTRSPNVCIAGGVGLNCTINGQVTSNSPFQNIFVMPAPHDAGISIGAALAASAALDPAYERRELRNAFLGSSYGATEVKDSLELVDRSEVWVGTPNDLIELVADLLHVYAIVGWFQGCMEFGPRALGNRSILANPTRPEMKDEINGKVKFRESFRPFSPVVPAEQVAEYFEIDGESPFMLQITRVVKNKRSVIPSVTHVDGSARVQTVTLDQNPAIYRLLYAMDRRSGVPVLLNTSFNIAGDTLVRTPKDAINCFLNTGLDAVVIGSHVLVKRDQSVLNQIVDSLGLD